MERLTEKQNGGYILPCDGENLLNVSTSSNTVMIDDFKWETTPRVTGLSGKFIDKLGELEDVLEKWHIEDLDKFIEELKQKAIVSKYKTGDKVYGIIDTWAYTDVLPVEIRGICLLYEVWDGENTTKQHYTRIFATKEEAEQKLAEIGGKNE